MTVKIAIAALVLTLGVFGYTDADMTVQNIFFNAQTGHWLWDKHESVARAILYTGPKVIIILFGVCCVVALFLTRWFPQIALRRNGLIIVVLSLIVIPSTVGLLKSVTNVACPTNIEHFDGSIPDVKLFESYPPSTAPEKSQRCFPAGHASGGYALFALIFLFQSKRGKFLAAGAAFSIGTAMGVYKMIIGDHFLSHTLVTMQIAVIIVCVISDLVSRILLRLPGPQPSEREN